MTAPTKCPPPERLSQLLTGSLSEGEQSELTGHLDDCPVCRQQLEQLAGGAEAWHDTARKLGEACGDEAEPALRDVLDRMRGAAVDERTQAEIEPAADDVRAFLQPPSGPGQLGRLDHYEVMEIVGRGGMGVVLKAFDTRLHRVVAIKVMAAALASSGSARQRFLREARAAAAVRNEHVIDIHAVGEENGLPYLVMEYIAGRSLQERIDQSGPMQPREVLRIGLQTARGLAAAHAQGLIHRDVKPANILLENGVERVKLTDFGLARAVDDASLTQSGVVTGTPQYMSPEQARGEAVDHRTDLFSLGSVLYAMCAGRPPFRAGTTMGVLRLVSDEAPRPIREVNPDVPERLAAIIAKLHAKDPAERFQTAAEVAEVLSQFLAELQQPDAVRPAPREAVPAREGVITAALPHRRGIQKVGWRKVMMAAAAGALLVAGLALAEMAGVTHLLPAMDRLVHGEGTLSWASKDPDACLVVRRDGAEVARLDGQVREVHLRAGEYRVQVIRKGIPQRDTRGVVTIYKGGTVSLRDVRDDELAAGKPAAKPAAAVTIEPEPLPVMPPGTPMNDMALVSRPPALDGVRSWTVETIMHRSGIEAIALSPDGRRLATSERSGVIRLWDVDTGRLLRMIVAPGGWIINLAWSADGQTLASACIERGVHFWGATTGRLLRTVPEPKLKMMAWSPDGKYLATGNWDNRVRLWAAATGRLLETFSGHQGFITSLDFSPDSKTLASGSADATVRLWDVVSAQPRHVLRGHESDVRGLAWSPDGQTLATGSYDRTIGLWDPATGHCRLRLQGHKDHVYTLAWSHDGKRLASGSVDHTVRLWNAVSGDRLATLDGHEHIAAALAWSPDDETLLSASWDGTVRFWQPGTGQLRRTLPGLTAWGMNHARWSPDGRMLATGAVTMRLWEASTGVMMRALPEEAGIVRGWSPDSKTVLTSRWDHGLGRWDAATGESRGRLKGHDGPIHTAAYSPDGKWIASGGEKPLLRLWDAGTGQLLDSFDDPTENQVRALAWAPDSKTLFSVAPGSTPRVWGLLAGKLTPMARTLRIGRVTGNSFGSVLGLAVSPDGKTLAVGREGAAVELWDISSGKLLRTLRKHTVAVNALAWTPDGKTLASGGGWGEVNIWEADSGRLLHARRVPSVVIALSWSSDGRRLAVGTEGPITWILDAAARQEAVLVGLPYDRFLTVAADGHYRCSPGITDQLRYVVQTDRGQETLTAEEFARKYRRTNQPNKVRVVAPVPQVPTENAQRSLGGHTNWVISVAFSPDGLQALSASHDRTLRLWDVKTGQEVHRFRKTLSDWVEAVAFSPDGHRALSGCADKTMRLWDVAEGQELRCFRGHTAGVRAVAFSPDGRRAVSGSKDGTVRLWDIESGEELRRLKGHLPQVECVAYSPDGRQVLSGGWDHEVRLWDVTTGEQRHCFSGHTSGIESVAFSPDGRLVLSGSGDATVRMWDPENGREPRCFTGHQGPVNAVTFCPDGLRLISAGADGIVRLWDRESGRQRRRFLGHKDWVFGVACSRDGRYVLSGGGGGLRDGQPIPGSDYALRVWALPVNDPE